MVARWWPVGGLLGGGRTVVAWWLGGGRGVRPPLVGWAVVGGSRRVARAVAGSFIYRGGNAAQAETGCHQPHKPIIGRRSPTIRPRTCPRCGINLPVVMQKGVAPTTPSLQEAAFLTKGIVTLLLGAFRCSSTWPSTRTHPFEEGTPGRRLRHLLPHQAGKVTCRFKPEQLCGEAAMWTHAAHYAVNDSQSRVNSLQILGGGYRLVTDGSQCSQW